MSTEKSDSSARLAIMFNGWKVEHERLDAAMMQLFEWMNADSHVRTPPLDEAAERLRELQELLRVHFLQEVTLCGALAENHGGATYEMLAMGERVTVEHHTLMERLQGIIAMLSDVQTDGGGWPEVVVQFNLFYDLLEQHEEQEENSVQWLQ